MPAPLLRVEPGASPQLLQMRSAKFASYLKLARYFLLHPLKLATFWLKGFFSRDVGSTTDWERTHPALAVLCLCIGILNHYPNIVTHVKVVVNCGLQETFSRHSPKTFSSPGFPTEEGLSTFETESAAQYLVLPHCSKYVGTFFIYTVESKSCNWSAVAFLQANDVQSVAGCYNHLVKLDHSLQVQPLFVVLIS